ncbi:LysR family transcriptional regulator [Sphingomonas yantingensis]|uniref:DNA-binding transcriptional LysR family regulator n=1 Tax=Sphingomonas yantingensis TaxID=1241761 RepID=A0A7W9APM8_9SPHN|nr:LysR family transcriptional regulator [Sphingomonas yantingensis]MBB5698081.1 DNA-binding transcriptional LysR family regulator [Sphingomonas yantingensis]
MMRLDQFDLNLLVAFNVLVEERNVTRAAARMNVTQSAMSAALKRLREAFADEILVQHGRRMLPTSNALALAPQVSAAIVELRSILSTGMAFDPAEARRVFRLVASDYIATVLISPLLARLEAEAPHVRLDITLPRSSIGAMLQDGEIDLIISPETFLEAEHPRELVFEERHVVVGCASNPVFTASMTPDAFYGCGHVAVSVSRDGTFIDNWLRQQGDRRRIEVTCASFIQAPWMLPGTRRLALMHERLARVMAPGLGLAIAEAPFDLPVMREMMQHHRARSTDRGLAWLRQRIVEQVTG